MDKLIKTLLERTQQNNYPQLEEICDELARLTSGDIGKAPVFYRRNMVIIRADMLMRLVNAAKDSEAMKAAIFVLLAMLAVHAPVVPVASGEASDVDDDCDKQHVAAPDVELSSESERDELSGSDAYVADLEHQPLCDYDVQGVKGSLLRKQFGIHRNAFARGMVTLMELGLAAKLQDNSFVLIYAPDTENIWSMESLHRQLDEFIDVAEAFELANVIGNIIPEDYADCTEAKFPDKDEAEYMLNSIMKIGKLSEWNEAVADCMAGVDDVYGTEMAMTIAKLFADVPFVSRCGDFCLIRQELLEYILLHGYSEPADGFEHQGGQLSKMALVVLLFLLAQMTDAMGYLCKNPKQPRNLLQLKDISVEMKLAEPVISEAVRYWLDIGVLVRITDESGIKGYRFSNMLTFQMAGQVISYTKYRQEQAGN